MIFTLILVEFAQNEKEDMVVFVFTRMGKIWLLFLTKMTTKCERLALPRSQGL